MKVALPFPLRCLLCLFLFPFLSFSQDNALLFDGTNDHITFVSGPTFDGNGTMSFEAWVYPSTVAGTQVIASWNGTGGSFMEFQIRDGVLEMSQDDGINGVPQTGTGILEANEWTHIGFTQSSGTITFYINGAGETVLGPAGPAGASSTFALGVSTSGTNHFGGLLDEVRIWDIALTQTTIQNQMFNALTGAEGNLIAYYPFNESTGTTLPDLDSTPASYDGVLVNFPALTDPNWQLSSALTEVFTVTNINDDFGGSLRQAIVSANASTADDVLIDFDIAGGGPWTISLVTELPNITRSMTIDGNSQTGWDFGTEVMVTLDLSGIVSGQAFDLRSSNIQVAGLRIHNASNAVVINGDYDDINIRQNVMNLITGTAINIVNGDQITIQGNHIGVSGDGLSNGSTNGAIAAVNSDDLLIGGDRSSSEENMIAGNTASSYLVNISSCLNVDIQGNVIGASLDGNDITTSRGVFINNTDDVTVGGATTDFRNYFAGINGEAVLYVANGDVVNITNNYFGVGVVDTHLIGNGATPLEGIHFFSGVTNFSIDGNVISGGLNEGILIGGTSGSGSVTNNLIGLAPDGVTAFGNGTFGINISTASLTVTNLTIGGTGNENTIAYNNVGVRTSLTSFGSIDVQENSIFCNTTAGIDISGTPTVDAPVITFINPTTIRGTSGEADGSIVRIYEVDPSCTDNQGAVFIGQTTVASSSWSATGTFDYTQSFVATVHDGTEGSSEFSAPVAMRPFITTWLATGGTITIPTITGTYDYNIVWTNLTSPGTLEGSATVSSSASYVISGMENGSTYQVEITGTFPRFYMNNDVTNSAKLLSITQWGDISWGSIMTNAFYGCTALTIPALDAPDLSSVTNMTSFFRNASAFNEDISHWDLSNVNFMSGMFEGASNFNNGGQPLNWGNGVSNVSNMNSLFRSASSFNQDISGWEVSNVTGMSTMFMDASAFNNGGGVLNWGTKTGMVTDMSFMFLNASAFNQDISDWDVSQVANMGTMFNGASLFNQNLGEWDISAVVSVTAFDGMSNMLNGTALSTANYDATLTGWATLDGGETIIPTDITLDATGLTYCISETERTALLNVGTTNWTINDAGADCSEAFTVINTNDAGVGSLRWAIDNANTRATKETVSFNIPGVGPWIIALASQLPTIDNVNNVGMILDATTQPTSNMNAGLMVTLDGAAAAASDDGLRVEEPDVEIYGFHIINLDMAITSTSGMDNVIIGAPNMGNVLGGNNYGLFILNTSGGLIQGNRIGTTMDGLSTNGNTEEGIRIASASDNIQIGGDSSLGEGNLISGNGTSSAEGVQIDGSDFIQLYGNLIGTNRNGEGDLGNRTGVLISTGADNIDIGSSAANHGNVISGSDAIANLYLTFTPSNVVIENNIIGLNSAGDTGIDAGGGVDGIHIGGNALGVEVRGNTISGMSQNGIEIGNATLDVEISNNFIGTNSSGTGSGTGLANLDNGIYIGASDGVNNTTDRIEIIGNVISGNASTATEAAIDLASSATNILIQNNNIGVEADGTTARANSGRGIIFSNLASNVELTGNVIANNTSDGIFFEGVAVSPSGLVLGTDNSYFCNGGLGINIGNTATVGIPEITHVTALEISGTSTSSAGTVEVFTIDASCADNQGAVFVETATINLDGTWNISSGSYDMGATYVAYADDATNGISEFSVTTTQSPFITTWVATGGDITIPTLGAGYNYDVYIENAGDPTENQTLTSESGNTNITGLIDGDTYRVEISGVFPRIYFGGGAERLKIQTVEQWGGIEWTSFGNAFEGCEDLVISDSDAPDLSAVTHMNFMFQNATNFDSPIDHWDVTGVQNFEGMFQDATTFNQSLNNWTVTGALNMQNMFRNANAFTQDLNLWTPTSVTNMHGMFSLCDLFDGNITTWDVSSVEFMSNMFFLSPEFNQPIGNWSATGNTGNVSTMEGMFRGAAAFDQSLAGWDVSGVETMAYMFEDAIVFDQDLSSWVLTSLLNMQYIFNNATLFDGNISNWTTDNVTNMRFAFQDAVNFDQPLNWNVDMVTTMWNMFHGATAFNQDISPWDVSQVSVFSGMFQDASSFNQDLSAWGSRLGMASTMTSMFLNATAFDQSLSSWDIGTVTDIANMLSNSGLSVANYDATLIGWEAQGPPFGLTLGADGLEYCTSETARDDLGSLYDWTINDTNTADCSVAFEVTNTNDSGEGSLRWTMDNASLVSGSNTITFNISISDPNHSAGVWTISPSTDLPDILETIILDATSQPGVGDFKIVLDGQGTLSEGFHFTGINAAGSAVLGFYITDFSRGIRAQYASTSGITIGSPTGRNTIVNCTTGIEILNAQNVVIQSNYIGTDELGSALVGNSNGIQFTASPNHTVGGSGANEGNVISGNTNGIRANASAGQEIIGNFIGTTPDGLAALGNTVSGILLSTGSGHTVTGNVISGNDTRGLYISNSSNNIIQDNYFGVGADGTTSVPNGIGIETQSGSTNADNQIGGLGLNEANIIANNTSWGISLRAVNDLGNDIIGNEIYCNGLLGIDLQNGSNNSMVPPVITALDASSASGTGISGDDIHLYRSNSGCVPGQGEEYLGTATVNGSGDWTISGLTIDIENDGVTATSTNPTDGTSQFSAEFMAAPGHALHFDGDGHVDLGDVTFLDGLSALTMEAWFNTEVSPFFTASNEHYSIIAKGQMSFAGSNAAGIYFRSTDGGGDLIARVGTGSGTQTASFTSTNITENQWYHVALTWTSSGNVNMYVNGELVASSSSTLDGTIDDISESLYFGNSDSGSENQFEGLLDEVRIWNVERTQSDILANISTPLIGSEANLLAYYRFDEGVADGDNTSPAVDVLPDRTSNANDGSLVGFTLNGTTSNWVDSGGLPDPDLYTVTNTADSGIGSLRWAMTNANADGEDVGFDIVGEGPWTISPLTNLPALTDRITIDGSTQPGWSDTNLIVIQQAGTSTTGIEVTFDDCEVYGLEITGFDGVGDAGIHYNSVSEGQIGSSGRGNVLHGNYYGIRLTGSSQIVMRGNKIGTDNTGLIASANNRGIDISSGSDHRIGGSGVGDGNVISGNTGMGVNVLGGTDTYIFGNYIGVTAAGDALLSNGGVGISLNGADHIVGGSGAGEKNVIAGNSGANVSVVNASGVDILGNNIGVDANGLDIGGTTLFGVEIGGGSDNTIGGIGAGEENVIANHTNAGVWVSPIFSSTNNTQIVGNLISCNGTGIDLQPGANNDKLPPSIDTITATDVQGTGVNGDEVHVYRDNSGCTPLDGQGQEYLGTATVVAGTWQITGLTLAPATDVITATASNGTDGTSEFTTYTPTIVPPGNALDFDGTDDYVTLGNPSELMIAGDLTLEAWINWDGISPSNTQTIVSRAFQHEPSPNNILYEFGIDTEGKLFFSFEHDAGTDSPDLSSIDVMPHGEWMHVAVVRDATAMTVTLYLNGAPLSMTTNSYPSNANGGESASQEVRIGGKNPSNFDYFDGRIDEVRIWDSVRSQVEINSNLTAPVDGNETNLVGYYRFDEGTDGVINSGIITLPDLTANAIDGTLTNFDLGVANVNESNWTFSGAFAPFAPTNLFTTEVSSNQIDLSWQDNSSNETDFIIERSDGNLSSFAQVGTTASDVPSFSDGTVTSGNGYFYRVIASGAYGDSNPSNEKFGSTITPPGNALQFDGTDDVVDFADPIQTSFADFTIDFWINVPSGNAGQVDYFTQTDPAGGGAPQIILASILNNALYFFLREDNGGATSFVQGVTTLNDDEWHHVAYVREGADLRVYVDGLLDGAATGFSGNLDFPAGAESSLSGDAAIDELRFWSQAQSESDLRTNLSDPLVGNDAGLVAYYRFDQDEITDLHLPDRSTNNNNGLWTGTGGANTAPNWVSSGGFLLSGIDPLNYVGLAALYNSTDGANWTDNANWLSGNASTWFGVTVTGAEVTEVDLSTNNLLGTIPTEIGLLTALDRLALFDNQLSGTIPAEIGELTNLTDLELDVNMLTGSIPSEMGNLTMLNELELDGNQLSGAIPTTFGNLTVLNLMTLEDNQLTGAIPADIGNLTNLTDLRLQENLLTGSIPTEVGNLVLLNNLELDQNQLSGSIPAEIGSLTNLQNLSLYSNQLSGAIPVEIGDLTSLEHLDLSHNMLSGSIPAEIGLLTSLDHLEMDDNQLSGVIPVEIGSLTLLDDLQLDINQFTGTVPTTFTSLINLTNLQLNDNMLDGLPDLTLSVGLTALELATNSFEFDDLEPNATIPGVSYNPQANVTAPADLALNEGDDISETVMVGGTVNQYQWFKDGSSITGQTSNTLAISGVSSSDAGDYHLEVTNSLATGLTISSDPFTVSVNETPTVVTQDISISLDAAGSASITTSQIDNGSSDDVSAVGDLVFALDITDFDCTNLGANTVTLTVTDEGGNSANATATVTVTDDANPMVVTQDISVSLDAAGNATITASDIDNGSSDNCSAILSLDIASFDCTNLGANTVTLTATDPTGNSVNTTSTVTVIDDINPTVVTQDISVSLDAAGNATITTADIDNGSSDNCSATFSLDIASFDCTNLGANTVTLSATDPTGNIVNATATVTVTDDTNPTVVTQDIAVSLDATGNATITASDIDNGSSDNCSAILSLDITSFDCTDLGANTVTLTATDGAGNSANAIATITVVDDVDPSLIVQDITVSLDAAGNATITTTDIDNGSSDNCSATLSLDITSFDCTNLGANTVTLTATDPTGNTANATATVTVTDDINPTVVTQDITVSLDATGNATITAVDVDNGSSDNCAASLSLDVIAFDCTDVGANTVTVTVTDGAGNSANATATVTVIDTIDPVVIAQDISVSLDATGNATISPADVDNGSTDNCTTTLSLDVTTFDCTDLGANTVTLTVTDGVGNSVSSVANVTIVDNLPPTVLTQNVTIVLSQGLGSVTAMDIDNGTTDNCTFTLSLDVTDFTSADIGANTVTLTATDGSGNTATATAIVTVESGNLPPDFFFTYFLEENSPVGKLIGTIVATDPEGDPLTYTILSGNTNAAFALGSSSGDLTVNSQEALDFETTPVFDLVVQTDDGNGGTSMVSITINLLDVNEEMVTAIDEISVDVRIYPNPAQETLFVELNGLNAKDVTIEMFTVSGSQVLKAGMVNTRDELLEIDLQGLSSGIYVLKIQNSETLITKNVFVK